jgi:hypothetical protein
LRPFSVMNSSTPSMDDDSRYIRPERPPVVITYGGLSSHLELKVLAYKISKAS